MSTLHEISGCDDAKRRADVVFLHGLGGDAFGTWRHAKDDSASWPHWLGSEFPDVGVWSLGYLASPTKRFRFLRRLIRMFSRDSRDIGQALSLPDRAGQVLDLMVHRGLGQRPILLICHSLGGLLAKQILHKSEESPDQRKQAIFGSTRAVLFLATPHTGATLASLAHAFRRIFGTTASMEDLRVHDAHLRDLYDWYRNHSAEAGFHTVTYFESRDVLAFRIVNETSSHPGVGADPVALDEDHLSIAKPRNRDAQVYGAAVDLLRNHVLPGVSGSRIGAERNESVPVEGLEALRTYGDGFAGRTAELAALDAAWEDGTRVYVWHAQGGAGKTRVVVQWLNRLRDDGWRRAGQVFVHSFYSQGADERRNASSELFFQRALAFFGHSWPPIVDHIEQGRKLAHLLVERSGLLVLDGLEPLQQPPAIDQGRLKDPAVRSLLTVLSAAGRGTGMCLVTSRQRVDELVNKTGRTVVQQSLSELDGETGAELLRQLGVKGTPRDLQEAVAEWHGHAYSLMLLGSYLVEATEHRDIRRRREILIRDQDPYVRHPFHADHIFAAYVQHLGESSAEVAILHLLGFFDRPADRELLEVLIGDGAQTGDDLATLTAPLSSLSEPDLNRVLARLTDLGLLDRKAPSDARTAATGARPPLDAHPLLREYFSAQLQAERLKQAWNEGHECLYEHYRSSTPEQPETLEGMEPLYHAIRHGCNAGLYARAYHEIYLPRTRRRKFEGFSTKELGGYGLDLSALSCFYDDPWTKCVAELNDDDKGFVFDETGVDLRALGHLREAVAPLEAGLKLRRENGMSVAAAISAGNLSDLHLTMGDLHVARDYGQEAFNFVRKGSDISHQIEQVKKRCPYADALHQLGRRDEAMNLFKKAEAQQSSLKWKTKRPLLYSRRGYRYNDLLLGLGQYEDVARRAREMLNWSGEPKLPLDTALAHLALGRALCAQATCQKGRGYDEALTELDVAVQELRRAGQQQELTRGLLARAELHRVHDNSELADRDLTEAEEIAEQGGMRLHSADARLMRCQILLDQREWVDAKRSLKMAATLIEEIGYVRRENELAGLRVRLEDRHALRPSVNVMPLRSTDYPFLQVLLSHFSLSPCGDGKRLLARFDGDTLAVSSKGGKRHLLDEIPRRETKAKRYADELDLAMRLDSEKPYVFHDPEFPFRYASGGTLPILQVAGKEYYCLFYREVFPIGWNIANGGTNDPNELLDPACAILRELREELIILNPTTRQRLVFEESQQNQNPNSEYRTALRLWKEHPSGHDLASFTEVLAEMSWECGPDSIEIAYSTWSPRVQEGFFLNVTAEDFGIEVDRVVRITMDVDIDDLCLCDGETTEEELRNRPIGLFEVKSMDRRRRQRKQEFRPDILFWGAKRREASDLDEIVLKQVSGRSRGTRSPTEHAQDHAELRFGLCPVTQKILERGDRQ